MSSERFRRAASLFAVAALLAVAAGWWLWAHSPRPSVIAAAPLAAAQPALMPSERERETPALEPAPTQQPPNAAPHMTSAVLDRSRLCPGESTFLRMTAEDADDTDLRYQAKYLSPRLGTPLFGFGRWIRYQAAEQPGVYPIVSFVEDPRGARDSVTLDVVVENCPPRAASDLDPGTLRIAHRELDAQVHAFDLKAARERASRAGKSFQVLGWSFDDGSRAGGQLEVRHHYPVVLERRYSYYLVHADVSIDGVPERIEYGLNFYSYAAANLKSGYVALAADVERGDDTRPSIEYVVTFSNLTPYLAQAREFDVVCLDAAGLPRDKWQEPLELAVPGESSLEQTLQLDRQRCPGGASYELFGEAEQGLSVGGLWSYKLRPSAPPDTSPGTRERVRNVLSQGRRS
jgi:hypothetical protein